MQHARAREVFANQDVSLVAVERVVVEAQAGLFGCGASGRLSPIAVIACSRRGTHGFDVNAMPVDIEALQKLAPELEDILARLASQHI